MRAATRSPKAAAVIAAAVALGSARCSQQDDAKLSDLAKQGEAIYQNVCVACHHGDPNRDGALGPANAGASQELLAAKILRGEYPPGYTPKRPGGHTMPRFEYLADQIPALAAYLAEVKE